MEDVTRTKTFQVVFGVASKLPWPHHNGKVTPNNWTGDRSNRVLSTHRQQPGARAFVVALLSAQ
eukprot:11836188-Karenia_brevis.AAC.1